MTLLPHKSLLLTQTRDPPTAQIITFDTNASPSYRTNHHLWRKNVTLLPHKSSLLTQKRDPPTAQITTFDTNTWSSYRTTHHFWHECVTLLPHKSSLFTQKRDPHTAQMSNFDTFYWCLRVVLQVIVVVWSYICRSYDEIHACAVRPDGFFVGRIARPQIRVDRDFSWPQLKFERRDSLTPHPCWEGDGAEMRPWARLGGVTSLVWVEEKRRRNLKAADWFAWAAIAEQYRWELDMRLASHVCRNHSNVFLWASDLGLELWAPQKWISWVLTQIKHGPQPR